MTSPTAVLDSLVSIILSSVDTIKAEYAKSEAGIPLLDSTQGHPFDGKQPFELKKAVRDLEAACAQLTTTVADPYHIMANVGRFE